MQESRKYWLFIAVSAVFIAVSAYFFLQFKKHGHAYQKNMHDYVRTLNFEDRVLKGQEFSLTDWGFKKRSDKALTHLDFAGEHRESTKDLSLLFSFVALIYFLFVLFYFAPDVHYLKFLSTGIVIIAIPCLLVGITYPFLEIGAYSEDLEMSFNTTVPVIDYEFKLSKEFTGKMFYYYQNKSVIDLVGILFKANNIIVAFCIILFSIIMPLTKLILSLYLVLKKNAHESTMMKSFISIVSKWSMADVFVAAAFLAYLSFHNMSAGEQIKTDASSLPGLYFFLAYCMLSIVSSIVIDKAMKAE
ncbi:MAG: paraquat-inducible protein A [Bacteroidota bacterium]